MGGSEDNDGCLLEHLAPLPKSQTPDGTLIVATPNFD